MTPTLTSPILPPEPVPAPGPGRRPWPAAELAPHRAPMLLLDTVQEATDQFCRARVRVDPGAWYALADGAMPAWFGLELMAQTIATFSGHRKQGVGRVPVPGYLLGTVSYTATLPAFPAGAMLEIEARLHFWDESCLSAFRCEIRLQGTPVATATLKVLEEA